MYGRVVLLLLLHPTWICLGGGGWLPAAADDTDTDESVEPYRAVVLLDECTSCRECCVSVLRSMVEVIRRNWRNSGDPLTMPLVEVAATVLLDRDVDMLAVDRTE